MNLIIALIIIGIVVLGLGVVFMAVAIPSWAETEKARHESRGLIKEELAEEIKAELAEIKQNLAEINKMLREVQ